MGKRRNNHVIVGLATALVIGVALVPMHFAMFDGPIWLRVLLAIGAAYGWMFGLFVFPIVLLMGIDKLREQRQAELEALGDENVVLSDPNGERKLHDYLTAITSMEARIGMLQRSAPYIPPEHRPPADAKLPRSGLTRLGWQLVGATLTVGMLTGIALGWWHAVDTAQGIDASASWWQPVGFARLLVCGAIGLVAALPLAGVAALFFMKTEIADDAGRDRPEAT